MLRVVDADVVVIGAGAVGIGVAHALAGRGARVTVLERRDRPGQACSLGNAGIVGPGHVEPLASMEALREGIGALPRRAGPLAIGVRPSTISWVARFAAAALRNRDGRAAEALTRLGRESAAMHAELGARLDTGWARRGFLSVYRSPPALAAASHGAAEVLDAAAVRAALPGFAGPIAGGVLEPEEAHCDPERFVAALAAEAVERGVEIACGTEVLGLRASGGRVDGLLTSRGDVRAGTVVLAAGAWSPDLVRGMRVRLPVQGGKGYHVELQAQAGDPELPVYLPEARVVLTPLDGRVRVAGTLEIAGTDERVSVSRLDGVLRAATDALPALAARTQLRVWRGLRPCTPDGVPAVGRAPGVDGLVLATGHGMWGLQLAPVTGRIVADLLDGAPAGDADRALDPARF
jgi:D-amino-acid dehydrogenase